MNIFDEKWWKSLIYIKQNRLIYAYSLVPIRRHGSINRHTSFIWPCTFPKIWGVTINWINTQFWSTSRGTFDKNNLAPIAYTFVGVSINWIVTFSMPWGVTINWNMSSNWHQRVVREVETKYDQNVLTCLQTGSTNKSVVWCYGQKVAPILWSGTVVLDQKWYGKKRAWLNVTGGGKGVLCSIIQTAASSRARL